MKRIGIIGTGIFGTALALTAARAGCSVLCWARNQEISDDINLRHLNSKYLPNIPLPDAIRATSSLSDVFDFTDTVLLTTSAQSTRSVLQAMKPFVKENGVIVLCAKGIEENSGKMLSEIAREEVPAAVIAVLSGPGFAIDCLRQTGNRGQIDRTAGNALFSSLYDSRYDFSANRRER